MDAIGEQRCGFGGLLSPQGKILFDFFLTRDGKRFLLDVDKSCVEELTRRLIFYRLRAKVTIEISSENVFAAWGAEAPHSNSGMAVADPRLDEMGWRIYEDGEFDTSNDDYTSHRVGLGMPGRDC